MTSLARRVRHLRSQASLCTAVRASQSRRAMPSRAKLMPRHGSGSSAGTSSAGWSTVHDPSGSPAIGCRSTTSRHDMESDRLLAAGMGRMTRTVIHVCDGSLFVLFLDCAHMRQVTKQVAQHDASFLQLHWTPAEHVNMISGSRVWQAASAYRRGRGSRASGRTG